ncbi:MAG: SDR family NAD(P)-dependent oxidoreductase [bacterium]|nr:SDR family NAD(P)-dependent oxidoreductase [bacterium]
MTKTIIIGASSGIGSALAQVLSEQGHAVGLTGRRHELLLEVQATLPGPAYVRRMDVADQDSAMGILHELIGEMGGLDLLIINAGTGSIDPDLPWENEKSTIDVNVSGFTALANCGYHHFLEQRSGHLVGISSIAALRGGPAAAYCASKAYISNYLQGLRYRIAKADLPIAVTDIQPGFVQTAMAKGDRVFWSATTRQAAEQIATAIRGRRKHAYITRRWRLIAWLIRALPDRIIHRF